MLTTKLSSCALSSTCAISSSSCSTAAEGAESITNDWPCSQRSGRTSAGRARTAHRTRPVPQSPLHRTWPPTTTARRRLAYGPIAPRQRLPLLAGEFLVRLFRLDRRVVDILDDRRHPRGHIKLHPLRSRRSSSTSSSRGWGLAHPWSFLRIPRRPPPFRDNDESAAVAEAAEDERPRFLLPLPL